MAYRKMTGEEIVKIIEDHEEWLKDVYEDKGEYNFAFYDKVAGFDFSKISEELANDPRRADFSNVKFTNDNIKNIDNGFGTYFDNVDLSGANFANADFSKVTTRIFDYTHLNYTDFSNAKIPIFKDKKSYQQFAFGCEFRHANLKGVSDKVIDILRDDNSDLGFAITDKGVSKPILVPYESSQTMPNDYWRANFYGVPNFANCSYVEYTNIPFNPMVVTNDCLDDLHKSGYQFDDEKQAFLKFNEGQMVRLRSGSGAKTVDASELSKACCEAYLGKEKVAPKTVTNDNQVWFVKFNPTARAPKNAIEFVSIDGKRDHDSLVVDQKKFVSATRSMLGKVSVGLHTDMIDRGEHIILSDQWNLGSSVPEMGDSYPTYFFGENEKNNMVSSLPGNLVARGEVIVAPFVYPSFYDKSNLEVGTPYNLRTMNNFVNELMEVQNEKRIQYYKDLTLANGLVPDNMSDEKLTKMAEKNMILIKRPWQLEVLTAELNDKNKADVNKIAGHIDCMNDNETLALQQYAKGAGFLYYNSDDIAKQINYIAKDIYQNRNVLEGKPVPQIGDKNIDKLMEIYNDAIYGIKMEVAPEGNVKQKSTDRPLYLICPNSNIKLSEKNIGIVLDAQNKVIAWTDRVDGKNPFIKEMVSMPKEKALSTIAEKNEQLKAKGYKPVDANKMRTVALPRDAKWGLTVNGKHVDFYNNNGTEFSITKKEDSIPLRLTSQAILDASTYGKHFENGKWVVNSHRSSPVLVLADKKKNVVSLHYVLSKTDLLKSNKKPNKAIDNDKNHEHKGKDDTGR